MDFSSALGAGNSQIMNRSRDRALMNIELKGATLSPRLPAPDLPVNRYGVSRIQLTQVQTSPPSVRMTLQVNKNSQLEANS